MDLTIDTRTATEYGVVRTFADLVFTWTGGSYVGAGSATAGSATLYNSTTSTIGGAQLGVYHAFIQSLGSRLVARLDSSTRRGRAIRLAGPDTLPGDSTTSPCDQVKRAVRPCRSIAICNGSERRLPRRTCVSNLSHPGRGRCTAGTVSGPPAG